MHKNSRGMYHSMYLYDPPGAPREERVPKELACYEIIKRCFEEGIALLDSVSTKNEELLRLINMGHFMHRTVITTMHTKCYYLLDQKRLSAKNADERTAVIREMIALLEEERKNAEDSIPFVEYDSSIGFEPSMHYVTDKKRILWKIKQVDEEIAMLSALL